MTDANVIQIMTQMLWITAKISAPILIATLAVGLVVSILQSATQVQEVTLTFVPKLIVVAVVVLVSGNWMMEQIKQFTVQMFDLIPQLLGA
jgi:flagellar biosynthetic protein FliQ